MRTQVNKIEFQHTARQLLANTNSAFLEAAQLEQWRAQIRQHDPKLAQLLEDQHRATAQIGLHLAQKMAEVDPIADSADESRFFSKR